jgi:hypothetical protein
VRYGGVSLEEKIQQLGREDTQTTALGVLVALFYQSMIVTRRHSEERIADLEILGIDLDSN